MFLFGVYLEELIGIYLLIWVVKGIVKVNCFFFKNMI